MSRICPSCGYGKLARDTYAGESSIGLICPSCLFEFGVDEYEETFVQSRSNWIEQGCPFMDPTSLHSIKWELKDVFDQLGNLEKLNFESFPDWVKKLNTNWNIDYNEKEIQNNW